MMSKIVTVGQPKPNRLVTLDIMRGLFLLVIIIDHVELYPSGIDFLSGRGRMWISAAEGFFFISGLLVGYIYRRKLAEGFSYVLKKIWKRAALLYFWAVALTLLYTFLAQHHPHSEIKYGLDSTDSWLTILTRTMTFHYTYGWADFLQHYVLFLLAAPFVVWLLSKRLWWVVVGISGIIWWNRGIDFSLAWQAMFFGGVLTGFYWKTIQEKIGGWSEQTKKWSLRTVYTLTATVFGISWLSVYVLGDLSIYDDSFPPNIHQIINNLGQWNVDAWKYFEKWTLEPGRIILFLLTFISMYVLLERYGHKIPQRIRSTVMMLGQNSLFVYATHSAVIFGLHWFIVGSAGLGWNFLITVIVIAIMIGITWLKVNWPTVTTYLKGKHKGLKWRLGNLRPSGETEI